MNFLQTVILTVSLLLTFNTTSTTEGLIVAQYQIGDMHNTAGNNYYIEGYITYIEIGTETLMTTSEEIYKNVKVGDKYDFEIQLDKENYPVEIVKLKGGK